MKDRVEIAKEKGYTISTDGKILNFKNKELRGGGHISGYKYISFMYENKKIHIYAHRLQAYQKFGNDIFKKGIMVRHMNGIKTDNSIQNIEIGTSKDNQMDIPSELRKLRSINNGPERKYDYKSVQDFHLTSSSTRETMDKFNIPNRQTVYSIIKNKKEMKKNKKFNN
jgi:hypothetical protein